MLLLAFEEVAPQFELLLEISQVSVLEILRGQLLGRQNPIVVLNLGLVRSAERTALKVLLLLQPLVALQLALGSVRTHLELRYFRICIFFYLFALLPHFLLLLLPLLLDRL